MFAAGFVLTVLYGLAASGPDASAIGRTARHVLFPNESRSWRAISECDTFVREAEGWLFSPNYPSNYDDNRVCNYVIERPSTDTCKVELTLVDFDVDETPDCTADFLDLEEGMPGQRICGNLLAGSKKTLRFPPGRPSMTLRFRSDGDKNRKGFMLQVKQIPDSCRTDEEASSQSRRGSAFSGAEATDSRGTTASFGAGVKPGWCHHYVTGYTAKITSPGYPSRYAPRLQCSYTIRRADSTVCRVEIKFRQFQLDGNQPCNAGDFLELPDRTRLCGGIYSTTRTFTFPSGSDFLFLSFVTDNLGSGPGFSAEVRQFQNSCGRYPPKAVRCDKEISSYADRLSSPGYPGPYGPNERCVFLVKRADPSVCAVELDFKSFNVERGPKKCEKDFLLLPDGSKLCGYFTGKRTFEFSRDGSPLMLFFSSDGYGSSNGFEIFVTQDPGSCNVARRPLVGDGCSCDGLEDPACQITCAAEWLAGVMDELLLPRDPLAWADSCNHVIHTHAGIIQSPEYPAPYGTDKRCTYVIHKADPTVCTVALDFHTFDIEGAGTTCSGDVLELPDGNRLCGLVQGTKLLEFPPGSDTMTLTFRSDGYGSGRGFDIHIHQRKKSCGIYKPYDCSLDITGPAYRIASPGFPKPYGANLRCRYTIRKDEPHACRVDLDFADFDLERSEGCEKDYLELPDRTRMCGSFVGKKTFYFDELPSPAAVLYFVSDASGAGRGFDFTIRQQPNSCDIKGRQAKPSATSSCDRNILSNQDILMSPDFPNDYPNEARCTYSIRRFDPEVCYVELRFNSFDVEDSPDCLNDYLEIESTGERMCGINDDLTKVVPFPTGSETLKMVFKSDRISNRRGFNVRVRQVMGSCYQPASGGSRYCGSTSKVSSSFQSPNYPSLYDPDTDCLFRVRRARPDVCRVKIRFSRFEVGDEFQGRCDSDFLEVQGVKYCGKKDGHTVMVDFGPDRNDVILRFKTDGFDQRNGFRADIDQIVGSCGSGNVVLDAGGGSSSGCRYTYSEESFQIMSPGYQVGVYGPSQECTYTVKKVSFDVCALEVKYATFSLQESDDCQKDYLQVDDKKLCGKLPYDSVRTYQFTNDEMTIKFHSDESEEAAGFFLLVKQIRC